MAEDNSEDALSFYALLNVSRDASDEDIRRAFRGLAQVYHPDKQPDEQRKADAASQFTRLQEAYEVLIDADKRAVYDVYGQEGLTAGLEVGTHLRTQDELRAQWQQFQQERKAGQQGQQLRDDRIDFRGAYLVKIDATPMFDAYDRTVRHTPDIVSTASSPTLQIAASPKDHLSLGVQSVTRKGVGGSSFVAGYKRFVTPQDSVECHAMLGLKNLAQVSSTRQLTTHASATISGTWQPDIGFGLQLSTDRQLSTKWHGEGSWVIGPRVVSGMGLSLTRRDEKSVFTAKVEVGMAAGVSARYVRQLSERSTGRVSGKFGATGVEVEIGAARRMGAGTTAGLYVTLGLAGVVAKVTAHRHGQQLQVPIILSHRYDDWKLLAGAYILPPVVGYAVRYGVWRPLMKRHRLQQALEKRRESLSEVRQLIETAARSADLMRGPADRKTAKAAREQALVIVEALYGVLEAMPPVCSPPEDSTAPAQQPATSAETAADATQEATATAAADGHSRPFLDSDDEADAEASDAGSEAGDRATTAAAAAAQAEAVLAAAGELPPQWLDVTVAVRYMADLETLRLHPGVRKSGLMGFADVAPGEPKHLRIAFLFGGRSHSIVLSELQGGLIPDDATPVTDAAESEHVIEAARRQGWLPDEAPAAAVAGT